MNALGKEESDMGKGLRLVSYEWLLAKHGNTKRLADRE